MEAIIGGDLEEVSPEKNNNKEEEETKEETADLLEEFWFFGNLFRKKNRDMKRCFSDPCSSSNNNQETMSSKLPEDDVSITETPTAKSTESKKSSESEVEVHNTCQEKLVKKFERRNSANNRSHHEGSDANRIGSEAEYEDYPSMDQIYQLMLPKNGNNSASSTKVGTCWTGSGANEVVEEQRASQSHPRLSLKSNRQSSLNLSRILPSRASSKEMPSYRSTDIEAIELHKELPSSMVHSAAKRFIRSPHGTRDEGSEDNRMDLVVEDEDYPSMDQNFQLTLGTKGPNSESRSPRKGGKLGNGPGADGTKSSPRVLLRAPSLPPCLGRDEVVGSQSHPRFSKTNRQSSLNLSEILPPRRFSKGAPSYISTDKEMKRRILNRTKSMKNRGDLESEEVQGFKDLGFTFDRKDLTPGLVNILPGLQEKKNKEAEADKGKEEGNGPYLSEAWLSHNFTPPIPKWTPKVGSPDDMKAHIKFWARAVASNVGQEC